MTTQNYRKPYSETKMAILSREVFTESARVVDIFGQGCNYPTKKGVDGIQVDFVVVLEHEGEKRQFTIVFQSEERIDNLTAYNGYEMSSACRFGCDADESRKALRFMDDEQNWLDELCEIAEKEARSWLEENAPEEEL
jgi:hypothetical protein